ncbi:chromate transporter [Candidatus Woesebacteria bacterium]|nr:chromate transporter [Candidatus Woesebacteria bacterium]
MATANASLSNLETTLNEYFVKKAPFQLPVGVKEFIVSFGPWITLVMLVLSLPIILAAIGLGAILAPFAVLGGANAAAFTVGTVFSLATLVLEAMALPGLFKRKKAGWNLLFYASLVSVAGALVALELVGAVLSAVIGWYFIFQVRSMYK